MRCRGLLIWPLLVASVTPAAAQDDAKLKRLIERIATGDEAESADATEQLAEQLLEPLTRAIGSLEKRPGTDQKRSPQEVLRIRRALGKLHSGLRIRMLRLDLPEEDRKLFDKFVRDYPEVTENLFADNYQVRRLALEQVPLQANSGAGVVICARVDDEDEAVAMAALEVAAKLKDPVVARVLIRYLRGAAEAVQKGAYKDSQDDLVKTLAEIVEKAIEVVVLARPPDAAAAVADAVRTIARAKHWDVYRKAALVRSLGDLGDEQIAPMLLEFLDNAEQGEFRGAAGGQVAMQTVGDAALLALLKLYDLKPETFAFATSEEWGRFAGFFDERSRHEAHQRFRIWHEQNAAKPREQRGPLPPPAASRPG